MGVPGCVWTDVNEEHHKLVTDKQEEQMNKLGWRIIRLDESYYGLLPVYRRAFILYQNILFAMKDPKNRRFLPKKPEKRQ